MKNLSYTQEYYLCAVNDKGELKTDAIHGALFAGAVFELLENDHIEYVGDKQERVVTAKPLDNAFAYLKPLYDFIATQKKPLERTSITDFVFNSKYRNELISTIGSSLVTLGYATELPSQGIIKNKTRYAPKADTEKPIIEKIRAEILEDGNMTDETFYLIVLLTHSNAIHDYFSKVESDVLKKRLEEVRNSDTFAVTREVFESVMAAFVWEV